jgi:putative DNA primase/helicase
MDFLNFCAAHGIILNHVPPIGIWKRYPTTDHPKKRNGAVKFMGDHAFVQNHATDTEVSVWQTDKPVNIDTARIARMAKDAENERRKMQSDAAIKAREIMSKTKLAKHEYLSAKGFPEEWGRVYVVGDAELLAIPMWANGMMVGCQLIKPDGEKKFLYGQRTAGAAFVIDNKGDNILCEGYATALSIQKAMKSLKRPYTIHVCFSAGNLKKVAEGKQGLVIADNDASGTGERVAKEIGWPYWMSDTVGEDANDFHMRVGLFKFTQSLTPLLNRIRLLRHGDSDESVAHNFGVK